MGAALETFHEQRRAGIGATDTPKILGLSRWGTALTVYEDKLGLRPPSESSLPAWLGKRMQNVVGELYTGATGRRLRAVSDLQHFQHKQFPWIVCHLDFRVWGEPSVLVEAKTRSYEHGYGEEGTPEVPPEDWVQCQHEMLVTGAKRTDLAVLFGHHRFAVFPIERDEAFLEALIPTLSEFWYEHVLAGVPPAPSGHPADTEAIRDRFPEHGEEVLQASPEQEPLFKELALARQNRLQAERREDELANRIKQLIGEASGIRGAFGEVTWRRAKDGTFVAWEQVAEAYRRILNETGAHIDYEAIEGLYTNVKPGVRRFLFKPAEESK